MKIEENGVLLQGSINKDDHSLQKNNEEIVAVSNNTLKNDENKNSSNDIGYSLENNNKNSTRNTQKTIHLDKSRIKINKNTENVDGISAQKECFSGGSARNMEKKPTLTIKDKKSYDHKSYDHTKNQVEVEKKIDSTQNLQSSDEVVINSPQNTGSIINIQDLKRKSPEELLILAESFNIENASSMLTQELIFSISKKNIEQGGLIQDQGVLEVLPEGFGFLRSMEANYMSGPGDIYVSPNQIKKLGLRTGDTVYGAVRAPQKSEKYFAMAKVITVNFSDPVRNLHKMNFDNLTPLYPRSKFNLEIYSPDNKNISTRIVDIVSPQGKGQRTLIVAPPKVGKTTLLQDIAHSITTNHPEVILLVLLIDERPEEVTDMKRSIKGEVVSSTFDEPAHRHVQLAEIVIEKAKRLVENKKDVVILLDSITRLARAYNTIIPSSGKVLSGGVDSNALQRPKRFFGAARNIEQGGSLTIIGTAMVDTGSKMDEVIFEEFKGTGNSEIVLDRRTADKRIFPAMDIMKSGTRKDELLISKAVLSKSWILRRILGNQSSTSDAMEFLIDKISNTKSNDEFFESMNTTIAKS